MSNKQNKYTNIRTSKKNCEFVNGNKAKQIYQYNIQEKL